MGLIPGTTWFQAEKPYYSFGLDENGVPIVYSECCADTFDLEGAKAMRDLLDKWIKEQE